MEKKTIILTVIVAALVIGAGLAAVFLFRSEKKENTVYYTTMAPSLMDSWLAANQSSAYIAWEPYASSAVVAGTGRVLMWSNEIMPHHPCCIVLAYNPFLNKDLGGGVDGQNLTLRFMKAHIEATEWILDALSHRDGENYQLLVNMAVDFTKRNSTVVSEAFDHVVYGYEMNASFMSALNEFTGMYISAGLVTNDTIQDLGYDNATDFIDHYVDGEYIEGAPATSPSAAILNPDDPIRLGYLAGDLHQMAQVVATNETAFDGTSMVEKYGLNVESLPAFPNGNAEMLAFKTGGVDIGYLGAPPAIMKRLGDRTDTTIIAQANSEGSALIVSVDSDVHSLKDLIGKTVATPNEISIQHLLLKIALNREGIEFMKE